MKKIPTIFKRNPDNMRELLPDQNPDCLWVFSGECTATRKYDGTCCKISDKGYWKRREVKAGKNEPDDFILEQEDMNTSKRVGWVPVDFNDKANRYHIEAYDEELPYGTYELLGPKIQGNPEGEDGHFLLKHSEAETFEGVPRTFEGLREWLADRDIEGLVFYHPDGRMAKIKKRDYGQKRK